MESCIAKFKYWAKNTFSFFLDFLKTKFSPMSLSWIKHIPFDVSGLYKGTPHASCSAVQWNPTGDGLFFDDLSIAIFSITTQSDVDKLLKQVQ